MNITNALGLPDPIVDEVRGDDYSRGDAFASVTELCQPTRIAALSRLNDKRMTEDAADRIFILFGKLMHLMLARRAGDNALHEERLPMTVAAPDGRTFTVSGALDHYVLDAGGVLSDYKVTSLWTAKRALEGDISDEWRWQLYGYRLLLERAGFAVSEARIVMLLRDWSKPEARRKPELPQQGVVVVPVSLVHTSAEVAAYFGSRAAALSDAIGGGEAPVCTEAERWTKPTEWAVMRPGATRASRVYQRRAEAEEHARPGGFEIVERPGQSVRCAEYCRAAPFCGWWQGQAGAAPPPPAPADPVATVFHDSAQSFLQQQAIAQANQATSATGATIAQWIINPLTTRDGGPGTTFTLR